MGHAQVRPLYSLQEYYSLEEEANFRHEYCGGEIYMMAGASPRHVRIATQIATSLNNRLADSSCYAGTSDQRLRIEAADLVTYPDVVVLCEDANFDPLNSYTLLEPCLIVEVLSPSTGKYDQSTKLEAYKLIPTLSDYLIVWQDKICIEHHAREGENWTERRFQKRDDVVALASFAIELPLSEIYRRLDLPADAENE
jgi:Uma2 family endonuclease